MSVEASRVINQMKSFAFVLRNLSRQVDDLTGNTAVNAEVAALASDSSLVVGNGIETNITKSEFQDFLSTLKAFKGFLSTANLAHIDHLIKGL